MWFIRNGPAMSEPLDKSKPGFLSLPGELRNKVYRLTLLESKTIVLKTVKIGKHHPRHKALRTGTGRPLLGICVQVYRECAPIFYGENLFAFQNETLSLDSVHAFLDRAGDLAKKMKRIAVYRTYKIADMKPTLIHFEIRLTNTKQLIIVRPKDEKFPFPGIKSKIRGRFYEPCRCEVRHLVVKSQSGKSTNGENIFEFLERYVKLINITATHAEIEVCEKCNSVRRS